MEEENTNHSFGPAVRYHKLWKRWVNDPLIAEAGITFDRTPSGPVVAPKTKFRVCGYHIDFDERPTCYMDVETLAEAQYVCNQFDQTCGNWNIDFAVAFDDQGMSIAKS